MIHVVLVNYNGTGDTIACIRSLAATTGQPVTVTAIDNASRSAEREALFAWGRSEGLEQATAPASISDQYEICDWLTGRFGLLPVTLVGLDKNYGFAGGNNVGIKLALLDPACTHVWVLNNDTEVEPDALAALVDRMAQDVRIGICGSTLVYHDNRATVQALGGTFNNWRARAEQLAPVSPLAALPPREEIEARLKYVIGASMLVSRAYLEAVGPMDEGYFLYFEEIDWARRGKDRFKLGWAPDSIVYHKEGGAIGTSSRARPSDLSLYYMSASSLRFLRRHQPIMLPLGMGRLAGKALQYLIAGDRKAALVIGRAIVDFSSGRVNAGPAHRP